MNLPFSPTFFRKMDIFHQLVEYESQKKIKHLWEGEKALLVWAGSEEHQHLGSPLDTKHVKNALDYCVRIGFIPQSENDRMRNSARHILESTITHEFGELVNNSNEKNPRIRINRNGILAGLILSETKNLKKTFRNYLLWSWDWYLLYYIAGLLLAVQVLKGFTELILLWWKNLPKNLW